jgi:biotin operon repressor
MILRTDTSSRLLALLPQDGSPRSNAELRTQLGVSSEEYWSVRNQLLEEGVVTKSPGRGGRTALVVSKDAGDGKSSSKVRLWMIQAVFGLAGALGVWAIVLLIVLWGTDRVMWDALALGFGGVTVAAVGVSLLIYKFQTDAAHLEAEGQARILQRLETLARQAAMSSSDARDILRVMGPAVAAPAVAETPQSESAVGDDVALAARAEPEQVPSSAVIKTEHGAYYLPDAVPMKVLSDLVVWWDSRGETGRWTLSRLIGGYRALNSAGNYVGVPWILTFENGVDGVRSFRLAYSGRRKGPSVSELLEEGVWHDFGGVDE